MLVKMTIKEKYKAMKIILDTTQMYLINMKSIGSKFLIDFVIKTRMNWVSVNHKEILPLKIYGLKQV